MPSSTSSRAETIDLVTTTLLARAHRLTRLLMRSGAHDISRTEAGVLSTLSERPHRITELAANEALAQPTVTQLVDKLERRELVSRNRSAEDGRVVMVEISPRGCEELEALRTEVRGNLREALADLPDEELADLAAAAETLGALIESLQPDPGA